MPAVQYYIDPSDTPRSVKTGKALKVNPIGNPRYCQVVMYADPSCAYVPKPRKKKAQAQALSLDVIPEMVASGRRYRRY